MQKLIPQSSTDYACYTDMQFIEGLRAGDYSLTEYFFFQKCNRLFGYILSHLFPDATDKDDFIREFWHYLARKHWALLNQFDFRSHLTTWIGVTAVHYFLQKKSAFKSNWSKEISDELMAAYLDGNTKHHEDEPIFENAGEDRGFVDAVALARNATTLRSDQIASFGSGVEIDDEADVMHDFKMADGPMVCECCVPSYDKPQKCVASDEEENNQVEFV